jgi:hypothetical protein
VEVCSDTKRILGYCTDALDEIMDETSSGALWERRWASLLALLRTACEVLKREAPIHWQKSLVTPNANVKGRDNKNDWKPDIFGKFISTDANMFLHQGKSKAGQSVVVPIAGASAQGSAAGEMARTQPIPKDLPSSKISYHMNSGLYKNKYPRIVALKAIKWIDAQVKIAES